LLSRLRAALNDIKYVFVKGGPARKGARGEMQFLLPEEGLLTRIGREIGNALSEFRRNPRRFLIEFVRGEGSNRTRRNALLAGSEMAAVGYVTVYFFSLSFQTMGKSLNTSWGIKAFYIGFAVYLATCYLARGFILYKLINSIRNKLAAPKLAILNNYGFYCYVFPEKCPQLAPFEEKLALIAPVVETKPEIKVEEDVKAKKQDLGGSKPKPKPAQGGGGGGRKEPTPPSKGVPPQMSLAPQIIPPSPEPPKIKNPTLVVASTVYGDPKALPPMKGPIGDPSGIPAPPSSGPGSGGGIGRGAGGGVGAGDGGGVGPGRGGNIGGGDMAIGGGRSIEPMTNSLKPTILYKEKAKYTEEARQNKIQGIVILNVVFTADGRITSIKVVRGLPDGLTEKAIEAAQKIRFQPAVKAGQPVSVRGNLEFSFNLY
jgi:TonB family protein